MPAALLHFLLPGKMPADSAGSASLSWTGVNPGWAFIGWLVLLALLVWSYRRYAPQLTPARRIVLIALRALLLGLLLLMLARPTLNLEIKEHDRRTLAVLVDTSQSMTLADGRSDPADLVRAGIATGDLPPAGGLKQALSADQSASLAHISRDTLLASLAANGKLDLWPALQSKADLQFFGFGRQVDTLGSPFAEGRKPDDAQAAAFFKKLDYTQNLTAIGDAVREVINREGGHPLAGILVLTDGGNNAGSAPLDAARLARQDGIPLFLYGVGVTILRDLAVTEVNGPQVSFLKDRANFTVVLHSTGLAGQKTLVTLLADGRQVDQQPVTLTGDGEQEITLGFVPQKVGDVAITVNATPLPGETTTQNNTAATTTRVVDTKLRVLYIEGAPRWDYRYLLALLQRDRRIAVNCVVVEGDPGLDKLPDSPYLATIPADKDRLFTYDAIIIGDVAPDAIGPDRMKLISEWVSKNSGGLVFLAGPQFDPSAYKGTPLEDLFPVELNANADQVPRYDEPVKLRLTADGARSPMLALSADPQENQSLWAGFRGMFWTAPVGRAKPAAQVLLVDPTSARANRDGPEPVLAVQPYGLGTVAYVGTDSTYVWRSDVGERYHTRVWLQLLQAVTAARQRGGSQLTQLTTDRSRYLVGDHVVVRGHALNSNFTPLTDATLPGTLAIQPPATTPGGAPPPPKLGELRLAAVPGSPGNYQADFIATTAGSYTFTAARDPASIGKFEVDQPRVEFDNPAMNEALLRALADASGGKFLREEDLVGLPELVTAHSASQPTFKAVDLSLTPWLLGLLILVAAFEWLIRRRSELK